MENLFKQGSGIILFVFLYFALGSRAIEVVSAKEFNTTKYVRVKIWTKSIPIDSNGLMFVRVGTRNLQINCSIPNDSKKPINIGWRKGQNWLDGRSVEVLTSNDSRILRLTIDQVTWELNDAIYWCGPLNANIFDTNVKGSQVTIRTGDLPGPPIDIRHNIVDLRLFQINIKWKAPTSVGGLPAHYTVSYVACMNKTYCQETPRHQFCTIPHVVGNVDYKCSKLREEMKSVDLTRDLYRVTIATVNPLGESRSPEFEIDVDFGGLNEALYPTPRPPLKFMVFASDVNTVTVQWTPREMWNIIDTRYTILYHKDKDLTNKTVVQTGQTMIRLTKADGIEPFTIYYIYIIVEFINSSNQSSGISEPLKRVIRTPEGTPDQGPDINNISSTKYPHNTTLRNVTMTWQVPPSSAWHGKPSHIQISYRNANNQELKQYQISAMPIPPSQTVLTGLDSTVSYTSSIALCNSRECGESGNETPIAPIEGPNEAKNADFSYNPLHILIGVVIFAFVVFVPVIIISVCWFYSKRRKQRAKGNQLPLKMDDVEESHYTDRYQNVDQLSYSAEYDSANYPISQ